MRRLVCGIGFNDNKYAASFDGKDVHEYTVWIGMLSRCSDKVWERQPTYTGTTCSENFKSYSYFYEWYHKQTGSGNKDSIGRSWQLDKDLLLKGNKIYSEETCCFVPHRINSLLLKCGATRGEYPIGVCWNNRDKKFLAHCSEGTGKTKHLGMFTTVKDAFLAYKTLKEQIIKKVAAEYKEVLDERVYDALMGYEVFMDD